MFLFQCVCVCVCSGIEAVLLLVAAGPADRGDQPVEDLQDADDELQSAQTQQDGQQGHIPLHNVLRLLALEPRVRLQQVAMETHRVHSLRLIMKDLGLGSY